MDGSRLVRLLGAALAVLAAAILGPGLLSAAPETPPDPDRDAVTSRDAGLVPRWTGGPDRPSGNRFVQSPVRLLRLPA